MRIAHTYRERITYTDKYFLCVRVCACVCKNKTSATEAFIYAESATCLSVQLINPSVTAVLSVCCDAVGVVRVCVCVCVTVYMCACVCRVRYIYIYIYI